MNGDMDTIVKIIRNAKNIVVLTGAGISTESGIKDFRSRTGIYQLAPETVLSNDYFFLHPVEFYEFAFEHLYHPDALPNAGHIVLEKWEKEGRISHIITQNIDGLHQKADSKNVIEFHGTMKTASCQNCGTKYSADTIVERKKKMAKLFVCDQCQTSALQDRYIKPDVVLFGDRGEWFTEEGFDMIIRQIQQADCLLILGTSLKVTPFSHFLRLREPGVPIIIVNIGTTTYDSQENVHIIRAPIGTTLTELNKLIQ